MYYQNEVGIGNSILMDHPLAQNALGSLSPDEAENLTQEQWLELLGTNCTFEYFNIRDPDGHSLKKHEQKS